MMRFFQRIAWSALLVLATLVASCAEPEGGVPTGARESLVDGRQITVHRSESGHLRIHRVAVRSDDDEVWSTLAGVVESICLVRAVERFSGVQRAPNTELPESAFDQYQTLCRGYEYLAWAESLAPIDVLRSTKTDRLELRARQLNDGEARTIENYTRELTIPVLVGSDAATAALLAAEEFRDAANLGAGLVSDPVEGLTSATLPSGDSRVTLGFVVVQTTVESLMQMRAAAEIAERRIVAASESRLANDASRVRARVESWRARNDSRLEAASVWLGVPLEHFELPPPVATDGLAAAPLRSALEGFPVVTSLVERDSERRARDLLQGTMVDPRLDGDRATRTQQIEHRLRSALEHREPVTYAAPPWGSLSDAEFVSRLGLRSEELVLAAEHLVQVARARGREIRTVHLVTVRGETLRLVTGTEPTTGSNVPAAVLMAHSWGDSIVDHGSLADAADSSLLLTELRVRDALAQNTTVFSPAAQAIIGSTGVTGGDISVAQVCTEPSASGTATVAEFRVALGGFQDVSSIEDLGAPHFLVWGEAGLQCALTRSIGTLACNLQDFVIGTVPTIEDLRPDIPGRELVWRVVPSAVPNAARVDGQIDASGHVYVVRLRAHVSPVASRWEYEPVAGFGIRSPGTRRCTDIVYGDEADSHARDDLEGSGDRPEAPATSCSLRRYDAIPLEDVFTASGAADGYFEMSFLHYLDVAQRAAVRAENLGRQLISEQTEMNAIADRASQRLNQICGTSLNTDSIDPGSCGGPCDADALLASEDPSLDRLRRCVSPESELETVTPGSQPLCIWRHEGVACRCPAGEECPMCPVPVACEGAGCCDSSRFVPALPAGSFEFELVRPLGLVDPESRGARTRSQECIALAGLRSGAGTLEQRRAVAADLAAQRWLAPDIMLQVARSISLEETVGGFADLDRDQSPWMTTGSLVDGPAAAREDNYLCTRDSRLTNDLCAPGPGGASLRCGLGDCFSAEGRRGALERAHRAMRALGHLAGSTEVSVQRALVFDQRAEGPFGVPAGASFALSPLSPWLGAPGLLVTSRHRPTGDSASVARDHISSYCFIFSDPSSLDPELFPRCHGADYGRPEHGVYMVPDSDHDRIRAAINWRDLVTSGESWRNYFIRDAVNVWRSGGDGILLRDETQQGVMNYYNVLFRSGDGHLGDLPPGDVGNESVYSLITRLGAREPLAEQPYFYYPAVERTPEHPFIFRSSVPSRLEARVPVTDVLDGLELACAALERNVGGCPGSLDQLPVVQSIEDFDRLAQALECAGNQFELMAERVVLPGLPRLVVDDIRLGRLTGTYPAYAGEQGEAVARLRGNVEELVASIRLVGSTLRDFGGDLRLARSRERMQNLSDRASDIQLASAVSRNIASCIAAVSPTIQFGGESIVGVSWRPGGLAVCVDSVIQTTLAAETRRLEASAGGEARLQNRTELALTFAARMDSLSSASTRLTLAYSGINSELARLERLRGEARAELAAVAFLDRPDVAREWELGRTLRGRHNRTLVQYRQAHAAAVELAHLARIAVEQRIAMNMSEMHDDMAIVPAPSGWVDRLCETTGVDFYDLWEHTPDDLPSDVITVADYVERLKLFVDSYMIDYPFQNGRDTMVLSYREDLAPIIDMSCPIAGWNLLRQTEDLSGGPWDASCEPGEICPIALGVDGQVFRTRSHDEVRAGSGRPSRALGGGSVHELTAYCDGDRCVGVTGVGGIGQWVSLGAASYVLSWYERIGAASGGSCPAVPAGPRTRVRIEAGDGFEDDVILDGAPAFVPSCSGGACPPGATRDEWMDDCEFRRVAQRFHIGGGGDYFVSFTLNAATGPWPRSVRFGAPQLELATETAEAQPAAYFPTSADGTANVGPCESRPQDLAAAFVYRCEFRCPEGLGTACANPDDADPGRRSCFWESRFDVSLAEIERGALIPHGGFAYGNFNYRIDTMAVNLVGTDVRDCARARTSGCYSTGVVPFSLRHDAGFTVRNHRGEEQPVPVFVGEIVSADALATERYLTNPISSADGAALTDMWRTEFRGRPLNGSFRLRIHEAPGFRWDRVEDIQIALRYRYWTRQQ